MSHPRIKTILDQVKTEIGCVRSFRLFVQYKYDLKIQRALKQVRDTRKAPPEALRQKRERVIAYLEHIQEKKSAQSFKRFVENPVISQEARFAWDDQPDDIEGVYATSDEAKVQLMREAFTQVGIVYNVSELLNDIQHLFSDTVIESLRRIEDEFNLIRRNQHYTMVATDTAKTRNESSKRPQSPKELMEKIYGNVVFRIHEMLKTFHEQYPPNFISQKPTGDKKPSEDEQRAKRLHDEYEETMDAVAKTRVALKFKVGGENREVRTFEHWLHYMIQTQPAKKAEIGDIGQGELTRERNVAKKKGAVDSDLPLGEGEKREGGDSGKTIRKGGRIAVLKAWESYQKITLAGETDADRMQGYVRDLISQCDSLLRRHGFNHSEPIGLTRQRITEIINEGRLSDIYELIGVYAPASALECPKDKKNRLFVDVACARGLDIGLESVVITKAYGDRYDADDILQISGRCGRPSKSIISVVYMAGDTYEKSIIDNQTRGLVSTLHRYHYYRQTMDSTSIDAPTAPTYSEMRVSSLTKEVYHDRIF
jgi:hypothetical protein